MIRIAITILYPSSSMVFLYLKECTELTGVGTVSVKVFHNVGKCEMKPTVGRGNLFSFLVFDSFFFFGHAIKKDRKVGSKNCLSGQFSGCGADGRVNSIGE